MQLSIELKFAEYAALILLSDHC